jgi:hypothetical protein
MLESMQLLCIRLLTAPCHSRTLPGTKTRCFNHQYRSLCSSTLLRQNCDVNVDENAGCSTSLVSDPTSFGPSFNQVNDIVF